MADSSTFKQEQGANTHQQVVQNWCEREDGARTKKSARAPLIEGGLPGSLCCPSQLPRAFAFWLHRLLKLSECDWSVIEPGEFFDGLGDLWVGDMCISGPHALRLMSHEFSAYRFVGSFHEQPCRAGMSEIMWPEVFDTCSAASTVKRLLDWAAAIIRNFGGRVWEALVGEKHLAGAMWKGREHLNDLGMECNTAILAVAFRVPQNGPRSIKPNIYPIERQRLALATALQYQEEDQGPDMGSRRIDEPIDLILGSPTLALVVKLRVAEMRYVAPALLGCVVQNGCQRLDQKAHNRRGRIVLAIATHLKALFFRPL